MKNDFYKKNILITGGTGSFGQAIVKEFLKKKYSLNKIIIFSRDELKQHEMNISLQNNSKLRFFLGDIRDKSRLKLALQDVDLVVHAAALKQVPAAEYNPFEFIKTNILGAQNLIEACLATNVKKIIALSTDKACSPINLYGATKLCSDKLFISAQNVTGKKKINFSVVRYGNVFGSRGSILPLFLKSKIVPITDVRMTRFMITLDQAVNFVIHCIKIMRGGEVFVQKLPSFNVIDLAKALNKDSNIKIIGIRPGEKLHEELINKFDSINTFELKDFYIIKSENYLNVINKYKNSEYKLVKDNFSYNSFDNKNFLSILDLKKLIKNFK